MPVFIIAQPLAEAAVRDVVLYDVEIPDNLGYRAHPGPLGSGVEILDHFKAESGLSLMIAAEAGNGLAEWRETLIRAGAAEPRITEIGSHAARFDASSIQNVAAQ